MRRSIAVGAVACLIGGVYAQDYPVKPIRFIVPFAPGGGTDIVARTLGQSLTDRLGRTVIIDNRAGGGSTLGTALAVSAPPDGYTMVLSSSSMVFAAFLYKDLPYDTVRDLAPVSMVASQPNLLVVHPSLPASSRQRADCSREGEAELDLLRLRRQWRRQPSRDRVLQHARRRHQDGARSI